MPDVTWTGGITELKKISALCEAYYIPVSPHDAAGPINIVAGAQVMMTVPNFYKLETSEWNLSKYDPLINVPLDNSNGSLKLNPRTGSRHRDEPRIPRGQRRRLRHNARKCVEPALELSQSRRASDGRVESRVTPEIHKHTPAKRSRSIARTVSRRQGECRNAEAGWC